MKSRKTAPGFTLLELLTVLAIIVLVAALGVLGFQFINQKALLSKTKVELKQLATALEKFKAEYGDYPESIDAECGGLVLYAALYGDGELTNGKAEGMDGTPDQAKTVFLGTINPEDTGQVIEYSLVDPWGNKYHYLRRPDQLGLQLSPDFDLWSTGPNGESPIYLE